MVRFFSFGLRRDFEDCFLAQGHLEDAHVPAFDERPDADLARE